MDYPPLPGVRTRADVVFTRAEVAVFIDGCFWHMCPEHFVMPKSNLDYWRPKLLRNVERDRAADAALADAAWQVLRYWEHEDAQIVSDDIAHRVQAASRATRSRSESERDG